MTRPARREYGVDAEKRPDVEDDVTRTNGVLEEPEQCRLSFVRHEVTGPGIDSDDLIVNHPGYAGTRVHRAQRLAVRRRHRASDHAAPPDSKSRFGMPP